MVSWNIRDLLDDPLAVRRVLRALAADVVCLQEAPRRPGGGLRIRALAHATGLRHVGGGRTSGGTALLLSPRVVVRSLQAFRLPVRGLVTRTRGAVVASLVVRDGGRLVVACVHLPLTPQDRLDHARRVQRVLAATVAREAGRTAVLVAGDFNEPAGEPAWRAFEPLVTDVVPSAAPTYPAAVPGGRIDALLLGPHCHVLTYGDGGADPDEVRQASDHRPVVVDLELPRDALDGGGS